MLNIKAVQPYLELPEETRLSIQQKLEWVNSLPRQSGARIEINLPDFVISFCYVGLTVRGTLTIHKGRWDDFFTFSIQGEVCEINFL